MWPHGGDVPLVRYGSSEVPLWALDFTAGSLLRVRRDSETQRRSPLKVVAAFAFTQGVLNGLPRPRSGGCLAPLPQRHGSLRAADSAGEFTLR